MTISVTPKLAESRWIICDLDGTICDMRHRVAHAVAKDWTSFHAAHVYDPPHRAEIEMLHAWIDTGNRVAFFTGRTDDHRATTVEQLSFWGLPTQALYMRGRRDHRSATIVKAELLGCWEQDYGTNRANNIAFVLEDQTKLVQMWRSMGLTCWQPREDIHITTSRAELAPCSCSQNGDDPVCERHGHG
jgi:phosphoglycolate phosphatase-like HAD superfamily hydrolase